MSKEIWCDKFDDLIAEYEAEHPDCTRDEAVAYAEKHIDGKYADTLGDMIDAAKMRAKDEGTKAS
jgi:hypothetical protein